MKSLIKFAFLAAAAPLTACSSLGGEYGISDYTLVRVHRVSVGDGGMSVVAPRPWNERRRSILFDDVHEVEDWTLNGPILDGMSFVTGMKSGRYLIRQRKSADQQVPKFRADMTPPEIAAMLESLYRVRGGAVDFRTLSLQPRAFLGTGGFQFDYEHLDDDELWRKGRGGGAGGGGGGFLRMFRGGGGAYYKPGASP